MGLFGKKKPEEHADSGRNVDEGVTILGGGCAKCNALEKAAVEALSELGLDATVGHIHDFVEISKRGVMSLPALMVDGKVVSSGRVLTKDEAVELLKKCGK